MGGNTYIDRGLRAAEKEFEKNAGKKLPKVMIPASSVLDKIQQILIIWLALISLFV